MKQVFVGAIALAALAQLMLMFAQHSVWGVALRCWCSLSRSMCWKQAAFADQQDRAAGCQRHGDGRVQQRAVSRRILSAQQWAVR